MAFCLSGVGECLKPGVKLLLRHVLGIVTGARRLFFRHAFDKRLFIVEARPWTMVDVEVVEPLTPDCCLVSLKFLLERLIAIPHLTQKQRIEQLRRRDDLIERLPVLW